LVHLRLDGNEDGEGGDEKGVDDKVVEVHGWKAASRGEGVFGLEDDKEEIHRQVEEDATQEKVATTFEVDPGHEDGVGNLAEDEEGVVRQADGILGRAGVEELDEVPGTKEEADDQGADEGGIFIEEAGEGKAAQAKQLFGKGPTREDQKSQRDDEERLGAQHGQGGEVAKEDIGNEEGGEVGKQERENDGEIVWQAALKAHSVLELAEEAGLAFIEGGEDEAADEHAKDEPFGLTGEDPAGIAKQGREEKEELDLMRFDECEKFGHIRKRLSISLQGEEWILYHSRGDDFDDLVWLCGLP